MKLLNEALEKKWSPILDADNLPEIKDEWKRAVTAILLENQAKAFSSDRQSLQEAAPTNNISAGNIGSYDPILISLIRRSLPNLLAYDVAGVQPMQGPTGLIFAMRSRYSTMSGTEALHNEANTAFSLDVASTATHANTDPVSNLISDTIYTRGVGMPTANGEALGDSGSNPFREMAMSIDKVSVTARERALKSEYTLELAQDLRAIHGLDAEQELVNILQNELLAEINRELIRTIYFSASKGCTYGTNSSGYFDLDVDSNGRWSVERFKGLLFQIEREANAIAKATRRGKGNVLIVSADVASALAMTGLLDYNPVLQSQTGLMVDDTGNTYAGVLLNRYKVFVDPYYGGSAAGNELVTVGYKGASPFDAGLFYCPYVPLQMVRAVSADSFQPKIGYKTRYGMVANPFATTQGDGVIGGRNASAGAYANIYYRIFGVLNIV